MQELWRVLQSEDPADAETAADPAWQERAYAALSAYLAAPEQARAPHAPAQPPARLVGGAAAAAPDQAHVPDQAPAPGAAAQPSGMLAGATESRGGGAGQAARGGGPVRGGKHQRAQAPDREATIRGRIALRALRALLRRQPLPFTGLAVPVIQVCRTVNLPQPAH